MALLHILNQPYLKNPKKFLAYSLSFYESLIKLVQDCEILMMVRYWDYDKYRAIVPHLESSFFNHSKITLTSHFVMTVTVCYT